MFAAHFENVYQAPITFDQQKYTHIPLLEPKIEDVIFDVEEVQNAIHKLDVKKGAGPDIIPPIFLKNTAQSISKHLLYLFNLSLHTGTFPDCWKSSFITPIFKSGDKCDISNYRGIAILSAIPKLCEKMVVQKLYESLKDLIHKNQHGFVAGKSTVSNLVQFTSFIRNHLEKKHQIDAIYTDFSKAFDKVDHNLLVYKLNRYGIRGNLLKWIQSYLIDRKQIVRFEDSLSKPIDVASSVPQGSHIGPLLFLIFINDLSFLLEDCEFSLYADDLKIYKVIQTNNDSVVLQRNLSILYDWCNDNGMHLNIDKCVTMSFFRNQQRMVYAYNINGNVLERTNSIRDLGVMLDNALTMKQHVNKICSRGHSILGFIKRRAKEFNDITLTKTLYCSLVQSTMEYASIVWSPYTIEYRRLLESVQKQFLLFALKPLGFTGYRLPKYEERLLLLNMISLESRRELASALFGFDLVRGNIRCPDLCKKIVTNVHTHDTRFRRPLMEELHKTDYSMHNPLNQCIRMFNKYSNFYDPQVSRTKFKENILRKMKTLH